MPRQSIISKEAREYVIEQLHDRGEMTQSELMELIRPHCSFDPLVLQEQKLRQVAAGIIRRVRDERGARTAFLIRNEDTVIDVETCQSLPKVSKVEGQLFHQMAGLERSLRKTSIRRQELEGQTSLYENAAFAEHQAN